MTIANLPAIRACRPAWNKGRIVGQKRPLVPKHVWAIRVRLEIAKNHRNLALFNLAIASKLRGCDRVRLKVADIYASGQVKWPPGANPRLHELRLVFCLHHVTTGPELPLTTAISAAGQLAECGHSRAGAYWRILGGLAWQRARAS